MVSKGHMDKRTDMPSSSFRQLKVQIIIPTLNEERTIKRTTSSFYINLIGTIVWFQYDIMYVSEKRPWDTDVWNRIVWDPSHSPIVLHTEMLLTNYVAHINPNKYLNTSWHWVSYGLAPCPYDLYILCKFGTIPVLSIALIIAGLIVFIIKEIYNINKLTFTNIYQGKPKKSSL